MTADEATEQLRNLIIDRIKKADVMVLRNLIGWGPFITGVGEYKEGQLLPETITVCPALGMDINCTEMYKKLERK